MDIEDQLSFAAKSARSLKKLEREAYRSLLKKAATDSLERSQEFLQRRAFLKDLLAGHASLHSISAHDWPTFILSTNALQAVQPVLESQVPDLVGKWQARHQGLLTAERDAEVKPIRFSPCRFGVCVCKPGFHRTVLARVSRFIKSLDVEDLTDVVLTWKGYLLDDPPPHERRSNKVPSPIVSVAWTSAQEVGSGAHISPDLHTHISLHQQRPWRCTFMEMSVSTKTGHQHDDPGHALLQPVLQNQKPVLHNVYEWAYQSLRPDFAWDVHVAYLSKRHAPVPSLCGLVKAVSQANSVRLWLGEAFEKCRPRRRRPIHEVCAELLRDPRPQRDQAVAAPEDDWDLADAVSEADEEGFLAELEVEDEAPEQQQDAAVLSNAPSSGSSSTSSTSSSKSSSSSSSSTSSSSSSSSSEAGDEGGAGQSAGIRSSENVAQDAMKRAVQEGTHKFGPFRITFRRASPSQKPGWQATCLFHAKYGQDGKIQTRCTRSATLPDSSQDSPHSLECLRALYTWLLAGEGIDNKTEHQALQIQSMDDASLNAALSEMVLPEDPAGEEEVQERPQPQAQAKAKAKAARKRKRDD